MRRPAADPIPEVPLPEACRLVDYSSELGDAVRLAHNDAYRDHWGFVPLTVEAWAHAVRHHVPAWSKVVLHETAQGVEVVGYALTARHEEVWPQLGFSEGYTELLGVRADHRRLGLAQAMLAAVIESLRADGIESAGLDVDVVEATGAQHFYEPLGYVRQGARVLYTIEM
ncbi:MAG: GNAT family N-acetyltransferase [Georgenia sp.]